MVERSLPGYCEGGGSGTLRSISDNTLQTISHNGGTRPDQLQGNHFINDYFFSLLRRVSSAKCPEENYKEINNVLLSLSCHLHKQS